MNIFCSNDLESEKLKYSDIEILLDCLLSLIAVQNKDFRDLVKSVIIYYMKYYNKSSIEFI